MPEFRPPFNNREHIAGLIADLKKKRGDRQEYLSHLRCENNEVPQQEMEFVFRVVDRLNRQLQLWKTEVGGVPPEKTLAISQKWLDKIIDELDSLRWDAKISTCPGGVDDDWRHRTARDSLYYITQAGVSLRLKRANLEKGLSKVIQPPFEKIFFVKVGQGGEETLHKKAESGLYTLECSSPEFKQALVGRSSQFNSSLREFYDGEKCVEALVKEGGSRHDGYAVNHVYPQSR